MIFMDRKSTKRELIEINSHIFKYLIIKYAGMNTCTLLGGVEESAIIIKEVGNLDVLSQN